MLGFRVADDAHDIVATALGVGEIRVIHGICWVVELGLGGEVLLVEAVDVLQLLLDVARPAPPEL